MFNEGLTCKGQLPEEGQEYQLEQHVVTMGILHPEWGHSFNMVEGIHMQQGHVIHAGKRGILQRSATLEGSFKDIVIIAGNGVTKEANVEHKK